MATGADPLRRLVMLGAVLESALGLAGYLMAGPMAGAAALIGSSLALGAQVAAVAMLRPAMGSDQKTFQQRWVLGMAARFASFLALAVLAIALKAVLPAGWLAAGYLGTLLVLLYAETRFLT